MDYKIDKNILLPPKGHGNRKESKFPFLDMEVRDSFFSDDNRNTLANSVSHHSKSYKRKFTIRKVKDGFRVWRIE